MGLPCLEIEIGKESDARLTDTSRGGNTTLSTFHGTESEEYMKRIIDGKRYDTETAENVTEIGSRPGTSRTDFRYWDATLYRTPRGRWFIAGSGGAMTMFAESVGGGGSTGGSGLIPITGREAQNYLEEGGSIEALERWFAIEEA